MSTRKVRIEKNVLTREQCAKIIEDVKDKFERDCLKKDIAEQSEYFDKKTLDKNTIERSLDDSYSIRKVSQAPIDDPIFPEWDGHPGYRGKVMRDETGDFLN